MPTRTVNGVTYLSVKEAAVKFQTNPHLRTVARWMKVGVRHWDKKIKTKIRLKSICEGITFWTTGEWIEEFKRACESNLPSQSPSVKKAKAKK